MLGPPERTKYEQMSKLLSSDEHIYTHTHARARATLHWPAGHLELVSWSSAGLNRSRPEWLASLVHSFIHSFIRPSFCSPVLLDHPNLVPQTAGLVVRRLTHDYDYGRRIQSSLKTFHLPHELAFAKLLALVGSIQSHWDCQIW